MVLYLMNLKHLLMNKIIVTGGSGFIGSCLIKELIKNKNNIIYNIDIITRTSLPESLNEVKKK